MTSLVLTDPDVAALMERKYPESYQAFIDRIYTDIRHIASQLEAAKNYYNGHSEDALTMYIVSNLRSMCYAAEHDANQGGRVDIKIEKPPYKWLAEAKLWSCGYTNLEDGFLQLTTRYSNGNTDENHGAMIVYISNDYTTKHVVEGWRTRIEEVAGTGDFPDASTADGPTNCQFLCTLPSHPSSGEEYYVRNFIINLSHNPKDRKVRTSRRDA